MLKKFLVTTKEGKTVLVTNTSPFKVGNSIKASGAQPTLVLEI